VLTVTGRRQIELAAKAHLFAVLTGYCGWPNTCKVMMVYKHIRMSYL